MVILPRARQGTELFPSVVQHNVVVRVDAKQGERLNDAELAVLQAGAQKVVSAAAMSVVQQLHTRMALSPHAEVHLAYLFGTVYADVKLSRPPSKYDPTSKLTPYFEIGAYRVKETVNSVANYYALWSENTTGTLLRWWFSLPEHVYDKSYALMKADGTLGGYLDFYSRKSSLPKEAYYDMSYTYWYSSCDWLPADNMFTLRLDFYWSGNVKQQIIWHTRGEYYVKCNGVKILETPYPVLGASYYAGHLIVVMFYYSNPNVWMYVHAYPWARPVVRDGKVTFSPVTSEAVVALETPIVAEYGFPSSFYVQFNKAGDKGAFFLAHDADEYSQFIYRLQLAIDGYTGSPVATLSIEAAPNSGGIKHQATIRTDTTRPDDSHTLVDVFVQSPNYVLSGANTLQATVYNGLSGTHTSLGPISTAVTDAASAQGTIVSDTGWQAGAPVTAYTHVRLVKGGTFGNIDPYGYTLSSGGGGCTSTGPYLGGVCVISSKTTSYTRTITVDPPPSGGGTITLPTYTATKTEYYGIEVTSYQAYELEVRAPTASGQQLLGVYYDLDTDEERLAYATPAAFQRRRQQAFPTTQKLLITRELTGTTVDTTVELSLDTTVSGTSRSEVAFGLTLGNIEIPNVPERLMHQRYHYETLSGTVKANYNTKNGAVTLDKCKFDTTHTFEQNEPWYGTTLNWIDLANGVFGSRRPAAYNNSDDDRYWTRKSKYDGICSGPFRHPTEQTKVSQGYSGNKLLIIEPTGEVNVYTAPELYPAAEGTTTDASVTTQTYGNPFGVRTMGDYGASIFDIGAVCFFGSFNSYDYELTEYVYFESGGPLIAAIDRDHVFYQIPMRATATWGGDARHSVGYIFVRNRTEGGGIASVEWKKFHDEAGVQLAAYAAPHSTSLTEDMYAYTCVRAGVVYLP